MSDGPVSARRSGRDACPGALRVHPAADGGLARVRLPGGSVPVARWAALADAARRHGDGAWELTSRGNVQLRGVRPGAEAALAADLAAAGLLPSASHETVRNVVASPLSGRAGTGVVDVRGWAEALDTRLCADPGLSELPGRFLFAFDDGRRDVSTLGADVTVLALAPDRMAVLLAGADVGLRAAPARAVAAALAAARAFLAVRRAQESPAWRLAELVDGPHQVAAALDAVALDGAAVDAAALDAAALDGAAVQAAALDAGVLARTSERLPTVPAAAAPTGPVGPLAQRDGRTALAVLAPLGRLTAAQLGILGAHAGGELLVTPWRGVVLPDLGPAVVADLRHRLTDVGLVTDPFSPWVGVSSCTGLPGCAKAHADVRAAAARIAAEPAAARPPVPVHWVGCDRRCGHPSTPAVTVLATPTGWVVTPPGGPATAVVPGERLGPVVAAARAGGVGQDHGGVGQDHGGVGQDHGGVPPGTAGGAAGGGHR